MKRNVCTECGSPMQSTVVTHHYVESGLRNVWLAGVERRTCDKCGNSEVAIPAIEQLHKLMVRDIVEKPGRLNAAEFRFLRKSVGLSGVACANKMGVTPESVSRWENGQVPIAIQTDRFLRMLVVLTKPVTDYSVETLEHAGEAEGHTPMRFAKKGHADWEHQAAL